MRKKKKRCSICGSFETKKQRHFLLQVKKIYPIEIAGIVSDFGSGKCFLKIVKGIFPGAKHRVCVTHFLRYMNIIIPKGKKVVISGEMKS